MRTSTTLALLAACAALLPGALRAQDNLFPRATAAGGMDARQYSFGGNQITIDHVRQFSFPVGLVVPVGQRFSFDLGTSYAVTSVRDNTGNTSDFSSLTDTQLRMSYTLGVDALVASVMVNLPTGKETTTLQQFGVISSTSASFLLFPVNSYGTGFSVTPGLSAATSAGSWNLGLAASVRIGSEYQPFSDTASASLRYKPGLETRIRAAADRIIGQSRFTIGATFSTLSDDQLSGGGVATNGNVSPGNRILVDLNLLSPMGRGSITTYVWNYYRAASRVASASAGNAENILTGGVSGSFPLGERMAVEPLVEGRLWSPTTGSGYLVGAGTALRIGLGTDWAFVPGVRVDVGHLKTSAGTEGSLTGWGLTALLRYGL